ncbi:MAG: hypothetical protein EON54_18050 [Alcaligenaceae bacterium]|nr:MAG: hypothetical protein EON54_18050 [Alcaligenaceae bacterium]
MENRLPEPITPRDFELTIRFNPTTLVQGHNVWGDDGDTNVYMLEVLDCNKVYAKKAHAQGFHVIGRMMRMVEHTFLL